MWNVPGEYPYGPDKDNAHLHGVNKEFSNQDAAGIKLLYPW
jgi:hypothetical protein